MSHIASKTQKVGGSTTDLDLDMRKVVMSLWFRIPRATAASVLADDDGTGLVMPRTVPLVTWGKQLTGKVYEWDETVVGTDPYADDTGSGINIIQIPQYGFNPTGTKPLPYPPSYIGVVILADAGGNPVSGNLTVHIQTSVMPEVTNASYAAPVWVPSILHTDHKDPGYFDFSDVSFVNDVDYQYFGNSGFDAPNLTNPCPTPPVFNSSGVAVEFQVGGGQDLMNISAGAPTVTFDKWHHVLLSWDIGTHNESRGTNDFFDDGPFVTSTDSVMWCAVDDVDFSFVDNAGPNYGSYFPAMSASAFDHNALQYTTGNKMVCQSVQGYAGQYTDPATVGTGESPDPVSASATFSGRLSSGPLGLPAAESSYKDFYKGTIYPIRKVALAEFQLYTGVTLDTSVVSNRRAFVTGDGKPVLNQLGKVNPNIVPPPPPTAPQVLGKQPDVFMHMARRWIKGSNLGTSVDFDPSGEIDPYVPDPQIGA